MHASMQDVEAAGNGEKAQRMRSFIRELFETAFAIAGPQLFQRTAPNLCLAGEDRRQSENCEDLERSELYCGRTNFYTFSRSRRRRIRYDRHIARYYSLNCEKCRMQRRDAGHACTKLHACKRELEFVRKHYNLRNESLVRGL
jgi:hypothetical protein